MKFQTLSLSSMYLLHCMEQEKGPQHHPQGGREKALSKGGRRTAAPPKGGGGQAAPPKMSEGWKAPPLTRREGASSTTPRWDGMELLSYREASSSEKQTQFCKKLRKRVWLLVTECEDYEECDVCDFDEIIEKEEDLMQVESYLRLTKNLLWRQEEFEHMETRKRESTIPVVKGQHVLTKVSICVTLVCLLCKVQLSRTFEKSAHGGRPKAHRRTVTR